MMDVVLLLVIAVITLLYFYLTRTHNYWKKRGVPFIKPLPFFGNIKPLLLLRESPGEFCGNLYNAPEALKQKFVGIFIFNSEPAILLRDPELIKQVMVRDFAHFSNRNVECDAENDPIGYNNLFVLRDEKWKYLRSKLSPAFTSGRIKQMFILVKGVSDELLKYIGNHLDKQEDVLEMKELCAKFTTDVISTCAFGIQSNSLNDPKALFREFGRMIFRMTIRRSLETRGFFFIHAFTKYTKAILLQKTSCKFFKKVFWEAMTTRETEGITRNDFLDVLIQLKNDATKKREQFPDQKELFEFSGDQLVAQSVLFFTAGFETSATTISNTLMELAHAPELQEKLRSEIVGNLESHDGELTYEGVFEMKYLDKVVSEVLRKYPPMPFVDRICTMDYKMPDTDVIIRKGTPLFVALYRGLHYDPEYYPDPEKFDPERFSEESKAQRPTVSYMPFGEGPHICIGMRFALMVVKTAISLILAKYKVEKTPGTEMPMKMDSRTIILTVKNGLYLKFVPLK